MDEPPQHTRIAFEQDALERFVQCAQADAASVARVGALADVPAAVSEFLASHNLAAECVAAPELRALDWPAHLSVQFGATRGEHATSVTPCLAAIAETGSVALLSGAETPATLNLLPDNHVVVVRREQVVKHFEDLWGLLRERQELPRAVSLVTGPSRTADIEQTIQLGAHGPRRVHLIVVED